MKAEESFKRLEAEFTAVLKPLGYGKRGKTWARETAEVFTLVNLQKSQWAERFYVNLGAFARRLEPEATRPSEHHCHYRVRLTELTPDGEETAALERGLDFENDVGEEERLRTIGAALRAHGVAWLKSVETLEGMRERLAAGTDRRAAVSLSLRQLLGVE